MGAGSPCLDDRGGVESSALAFPDLWADDCYQELLGRSGMHPPRLDRGDFSLLILGLVADREMYGYELVAELRKRSDAVIDLPEGTVYPALRRLEREGLIAGRWVDAATGPRRRYYGFTPRGPRAPGGGRSAGGRLLAA